MARPKSEIDPRLRERILDATVYHINRQGFHGAKTSEIAAMVEMSESKLFRIFPTKAAMANEALRLCLEQQNLVGGDSLPYDPRAGGLLPGSREFIADVVRHFMNFYVRHPERYYFVFVMSHREFIDEDVKLLRQRFRNESYALVRELIAGKHIRDMDPEVALAFLFGCITRLVRVAFEDQRTLNRKSVDTIAEAVWRALRIDAA